MISFMGPLTDGRWETTVEIPSILLVHLMRAVGGSISFNGMDVVDEPNVKFYRVEQKNPWMVIISMEEK